MNIWETNEAAHTNRLAESPDIATSVASQWPSIEVNWGGVFFQHPESKASSLTDAYISMQCLAGLEVGRIIARTIEMGRGPFPDADVEANNMEIERCLPDGFDGAFNPGDPSVAGECDGFISDGGTRYPLEVGTMPSGKASLYLLHRNGTGFARWPYNSNLLWFFQKAAG